LLNLNSPLIVAKRGKEVEITIAIGIGIGIEKAVDINFAMDDP